MDHYLGPDLESILLKTPSGTFFPRYTLMLHLFRFRSGWEKRSCGPRDSGISIGGETCSKTICFGLGERDSFCLRGERHLVSIYEVISQVRFGGPQ